MIRNYKFSAVGLINGFIFDSMLAILMLMLIATLNHHELRLLITFLRSSAWEWNRIWLSVLGIGECQFERESLNMLCARWAKSYQSYKCSPIRVRTALSSRAPYTRAVIVMYVSHTSFQRASWILPLNSRREYLKSTTLNSHQKRYQANFECFFFKTKRGIDRTNKLMSIIFKMSQRLILKSI